LARMVIASLVGFMVSSQFVSLEGLELPYYVVMIGAATLKVAPSYSLAAMPNSAVPNGQFVGSPLTGGEPRLV